MHIIFQLFLPIFVTFIFPPVVVILQILMSASVDAARFSQYFGVCPIIYVPGLTYPVPIYTLYSIRLWINYQLVSFDCNVYLLCRQVKTYYLEEEHIVQWYQKGLKGENKNSKIWKNVQPFIDWLQSAESETEEE